MTAPASPNAALAAQARQVFVRHFIDDLPQAVERVCADLQERALETIYSDTAQVLSDTRVRVQTQAQAWLDGCRERLSASLKPRAPEPPKAAALAQGLSLLGEEAVENQILAARAALAVLEKGSEALNELRLRLQHLELIDELDKRDPVLSLNVMQAVVDAWLAVSLTRADWLLCQEPLHSVFVHAVPAAYHEANQFLLSRGVLPQIDLRELVRRGGRGGGVSAPVPAGMAAEPGFRASRPAALGGAVGGVGGGSASGLTHVRPWRPSAPAALSGAPVAPWNGPASGADVPDGRQAVMQRLTRFMAAQVPGWEASDYGGAISASVASAGTVASAAAVANAGGAIQGGTPAWVVAAPMPAVDWSSLGSGVAGARAQARALKQAAKSDEEKALIELVALIFDAILSEDRLPATVRVWFARLQMPVLRHALGDPSFLTADDHPARVLIDRMGGCVLGFDPSVPMDQLEAEIKRIVQVIEQYPDTGRRVFELMLQEFQAFLAKTLAQPPALQRVADVATQLECQGAYTVQYTIELRRLLAQAPVHEGLRDFLFQTWAEVMAHAAVTHGEQNERAVQARHLAADLLWAASAKPSRHERAQVIARVPGLMAELRQGLAAIGLNAERQEVLLKPVSDALAAAFLSRTASVDAAWVAGVTERLGQLEAVLDDRDVDAVPLSRDSLELITGEDASQITVLPNPETPAAPEWLARAAALPLGGWYRLEHNGQAVVVQLAWQSPRKQLCLLASAARHGYLLQQGRVAHYLHSGLLRPAQAEPLSTQATRQALDKLQANPERLLG